MLHSSSSSRRPGPDALEPLWRVAG
jgi:hypothetical protein